MKKLCILASTAFLFLLVQNCTAQNVVLINGQASEVILDGNDIETIVNKKVSNYLREYGQEPEQDFIHINLNKPKAKKLATSRDPEYDNSTPVLLSLAADRPQINKIEE